MHLRIWGVMIGMMPGVWACGVVVRVFLKWSHPVPMPRISGWPTEVHSGPCHPNPNRRTAVLGVWPVVMICHWGILCIVSRPERRDDTTDENKWKTKDNKVLRAVMHLLEADCFTCIFGPCLRPEGGRWTSTAPSTAAELIGDSAMTRPLECHSCRGYRDWRMHAHANHKHESRSRRDPIQL